MSSVIDDKSKESAVFRVVLYNRKKYVKPYEVKDLYSTTKEFSNKIEVKDFEAFLPFLKG